jgi:hypothetical protein
VKLGLFSINMARSLSRITWSWHFEPLRRLDSIQSGQERMWSYLTPKLHRRCLLKNPYWILLRR